MAHFKIMKTKLFLISGNQVTNKKDKHENSILFFPVDPPPPRISIYLFILVLVLHQNHTAYTFLCVKTFPLIMVINNRMFFILILSTETLEGFDFKMDR